MTELDLAVPTAREWMSTNVLTFFPGDDLFDAIELLLSNSFAAAPVVDESGCLLGMLTEKDCLRLLSNLVYGEDREGGKVSDYQSPIRVVCEPQMDLFRVAELFLGTNFPLLPVVDSGRLVGVISRRDVLRGVRSLREEVSQKRRKFEQEAGRQADRPKSIENMQRAAANQTPNQLANIFRRSTTNHDPA